MMSASYDATVLITPSADLSELSFCSSTPNSLSDWIERLPLANTDQTAHALRQATDELARLSIDWHTRLALLEVLREPVSYLSTRLDRLASASMQSMSAADDAQRLQVNLCVGYKGVVKDALADSRPGDDLVLALHRCLSDMSRTLLRACQLYSATPSQFWRELHELYRIAEAREIEDKSARDAENHHRQDMSIGDAYRRALLLATAKPNQLRNAELTQTFNALELWSASVSLAPFEPSASFAIDQDRDEPPRYVSLKTSESGLLGLSTEVLTFELVAYLGHVDGKLEVPDYLTSRLIEHLATAWSSMPERSFRRMDTDTPLKVAIGLRSVHYFVSGGVHFADQLGTTDALLRREINPFLAEDGASRSSGDVWSAAKIPENPNVADPDRILLSKREVTENSDDERYIVHDAISSDMSPEGYRVSWEHLPESTATGEIVTVRDQSDERWCVAVIRWLQRGAEAHAMGLELLAPRAIPVAARVIRKRGGPSDFMRALVLPEIKAIGRDATLITPSLVFDVGQKVQIQRQGIRTIAQLQEVTQTTQSFTQFTFRLLDGYLENAPVDLSMS